MKPNKSIKHGELKLKQDLEISANMSVAFMVHTRIQRHEMQTSKMSNKPKLSDPSPQQTSIVLRRQIKTMFLLCKSNGPHSAQIKVAEPKGMLTSLCMNRSPGGIQSQNNSNRERCSESGLAVQWSLKSLCVGQFYYFQQDVSAAHVDCR